MKKLFAVLALAFCLSVANCEIDQFIIGGATAGIQDFQYTLALRRNSVFICGASAITRLDLNFSGSVALKY